MNWKFTATSLGATLVATWLGWPPSLQPAPPAATTARDSRPVANDIQAQADRLQVRVRTELAYRDPTRNPFRFTERRAPAAPRPLAVAQPEPALAPPTVQPLPFMLSGMASDGADTQRTAILTTGADVAFVKEGDAVGGFTVTRVDDSGIDVMAADGTVRRLTLTP
jgi:hypothetical protein